MNASPTLPSPGPTSQNIPQLTEHLFRHESGKLVSILTGIFGIERLQMAEDLVQEALIRALQTWPYYGIPQNPAAWLTQTAKHLALDTIRREKTFRNKQEQIIATVETWSTTSSAPEDAAKFEDEIKDDRLRLMFACCHPLIPQEAQIALALKTLCGFSPAEIAQGFLISEAAIAKRLTRARQHIRELNLPFEIPVGEELTLRLDAVLQILYLLFNEGYKASNGESLMKESLCLEAIQLGTLLATHPATNTPRTHALVALMCLNTARFNSRVDADGNMLLLKDQNRAAWNFEMIERGLTHLGRAATGTQLSEFHLQAGIAACHSTAATYGSTDWPRILSFYDQWVLLNDSPIVALNRAVAICEIRGPQAGIDAIQQIPQHTTLDNYYLTHAMLGEFEARLQNHPAAAKHLRKAIALTEQKSEQAFLNRRLAECEAQI
ncbi:sigma-70 family RNA polymerase sigma factor [Phragmitibacter flavus]|uniref:Sigma-70 family RNA polymerase sigma factor n=1 Tax=Phragmitibacter flavus TaxID=2576071 RepID=A0A5R8KF06_9BACT|nr:sigma-70 family RNA polymerase sigma factor [Phragmitibacter flavus]TLD70872.1 sigma-70 family RNA polymerase sigma factor [Phragmitibacter flavus]